MRKQMVLALGIAIGLFHPAAAQDSIIGRVKTLSGVVQAERDGVRRPLALGDGLQRSDIVMTQADGAVGITFADNSMLSLGPDSALALERFRFDSTTNEGEFATRLLRGTLAAKSGKIVEQTPEAMTVKTRSSLLGVRGTEFVVRAEE